MAPPADRMVGLAWAAGAVAVTVLAAIPTDLSAQFLMAAVLLAAIVVLRGLDGSGPLRVVILGLAVFLTLRYLFWRTTATIEYYDPASFAAALALYAAELYSIGLYLLGLFVNVHPMVRGPAPALPRDRLPTVAVLVPSYNEPDELLRVTLVAARRIRYPADRLNVYLLDDGGTDQKRNDPDPAVARAARERHVRLQRLCADTGVRYLARRRNEHAKAGNLNAALPRVDGELILVIDADHVPTADILERTVGWFGADPKLFLVQTPHFFIAADPIEKNLGTFRTMPGEHEMFYRLIQPGLDFWNASMFCGSAAILRRAHLEEIGGFATTSVTEDAETSLELHARGYRSIYVADPMVSGLVPPTFDALVRQRTRWAQGMTQLLLLKNPLWRRGLGMAQRLCYLAGMTFWLFPFARLAFVLAPLAFLVFGLRIYSANLWQIAAYALPHLVASALVTRLLFGSARWPFVSWLYEIMQSMHAVRAILGVFRRPHSPHFLVTPKGEVTDTDFVTPLARPFYVVFALNLVAVPLGLWHLHRVPTDIEPVAITLAWALVNLVLLTIALGALYERSQRRAAPRMPASIAAHLVVDGTPIRCAVDDLSTGGAAILLDAEAAQAVARGSATALRIGDPATYETVEIPAGIRNVAARTRGVRIGLSFAPRSTEDFGRIVDLVLGDSERWADFVAERSRRRHAGGASLVLFWLGLRGAAAHARALWRGRTPARRPAPVDATAAAIGSEVTKAA
ncbi:MAG: UDP-forming cellulose synthase catalytic subunit [Rhodospirillales bacterium]